MTRSIVAQSKFLSRKSQFRQHITAQWNKPFSKWIKIIFDRGLDLNILKVMVVMMFWWSARIFIYKLRHKVFGVVDYCLSWTNALEFEAQATRNFLRSSDSLTMFPYFKNSDKFVLKQQVEILKHFVSTFWHLPNTWKIQNIIFYIKPDTKSNFLFVSFTWWWNFEKLSTIVVSLTHSHVYEIKAATE